MNSALPSLTASPHSTNLPSNTQQWRTRNPRTPQISLSLRRTTRRRRRPTTTTKPLPPPDPTFNFVIDTKDLTTKASTKLNQFVSSGTDAFRDLQTLITVDTDHRIRLSCRRSTVEFLGFLVLCSCVVVISVKVLVKLGFWIGSGFGMLRKGNDVVMRRDRSLGGREVVVARRDIPKESRVLVNPLSTESRVLQFNKIDNSVRREGKLPTWWPVLLPPPMLTMNKEEHQREANRIIRAFMDNRMSGKDILEDDVIQLHRIWRTSGARVSIDNNNSRDSFYRASVDFVLNICSKATNQSTFRQIDDEDACQFIAGVADCIGVEKTRAARIVSAAVAARTRSRFLQAWALEMQGKHHEAMEELSQICLLHQIFPPEESSAEMEMVARGLEKHLKLEQREFLMNMFSEICSKERLNTAAEALGLIYWRPGAANEVGDKYS